MYILLLTRNLAVFYIKLVSQHRVACMSTSFVSYILCLWWKSVKLLLFRVLWTNIVINFWLSNCWEAISVHTGVCRRNDRPETQLCSVNNQLPLVNRIKTSNDSTQTRFLTNVNKNKSTKISPTHKK